MVLKWTTALAVLDRQIHEEVSRKPTKAGRLTSKWIQLPPSVERRVWVRWESQLLAVFVYVFGFESQVSLFSPYFIRADRK
jgi:hypothetical protein